MSDKVIQIKPENKQGYIPKNNSVKFQHLKECKNGEKKVLATRENLQCLMDHYKVEVCYDVIKKRASVSGVESLQGEEENSAIAHLKSKSALHGLSKSVVDEQLAAIMNDNAVNPVVFWLNNIQRIGDNNPLHELVQKLPISNKRWAEVALYRWFIQCVAAVDKAQHTTNKNALPKYESVLTFFGGQGLLKTAFIRSLLPQELKSYLKDGILLDLNSRESKVEALSGWMTELGELDSTFKKSDISALKAFLSRQEDEIRKPYAKASSIMPRQTSFFASVNEEKFLRDGTGNRRYFPIVVNNELMLPADFNSTDFWAFIWSEYKKGEQWWLTKDEEILQNNALKNHEDTHLEDLIQDAYDFDKPVQPNGRAGQDVLATLNLPPTRANQTKLGQAIKKLNIKQKGRLYLLPPERSYHTTY